MNKGFTLVELIAVVTILALLAIITTPAYDKVSINIKTRNYDSKRNSIEAQTLSYVEKYMKNETYDPTSGRINASQTLCFTVNYLIQSGIISSDSETEEYIENDLTGKKYKGNEKYVIIHYDTNNLKLVANTPTADDEFEKINNIDFNDVATANNNCITYDKK